MVKSIFVIYCMTCLSSLKSYGKNNSAVKLRCPKCKYIISMEIILS